MLDVAHALQKEAVRQLVLFKRSFKLAHRRSDRDGTVRLTAEIPHRHTVVFAAVPAVDKHSLAHSSTELFIGERNVIHLIGLFNRMAKRLRKRPFELVFELIAATEEERVVMQEVQKLGSIKIPPKDISCIEIGPNSRVTMGKDVDIGHVKRPTHQVNRFIAHYPFLSHYTQFDFKLLRHACLLQVFLFLECPLPA